MSGHDLIIDIRMHVAVRRFVRERRRTMITDGSGGRTDDHHGIFEYRQCLHVTARVSVQYVVERDFLKHAIGSGKINAQIAVGIHRNDKRSRMHLQTIFILRHSHRLQIHTGRMKCECRTERRIIVSRIFYHQRNLADNSIDRIGNQQHMADAGSEDSQRIERALIDVRRPRKMKRRIRMRNSKMPEQYFRLGIDVFRFEFPLFF